MNIGGVHVVMDLNRFNVQIRDAVFAQSRSDAQIDALHDTLCSISHALSDGGGDVDVIIDHPVLLQNVVLCLQRDMPCDVQYLALDVLSNAVLCGDGGRKAVWRGLTYYSTIRRPRHLVSVLVDIVLGTAQSDVLPLSPPDLQLKKADLAFINVLIGSECSEMSRRESRQLFDDCGMTGAVRGMLKSLSMICDGDDGTNETIKQIQLHSSIYLNDKIDVGAPAHSSRNGTPRRTMRDDVDASRGRTRGVPPLQLHSILKSSPTSSPRKVFFQNHGDGQAKHTPQFDDAMSNASGELQNIFAKEASLFRNNSAGSVTGLPSVLSPRKSASPQYVVGVFISF